MTVLPSAPPHQVMVRLPVQRVWLTYALMGLIGLVYLAQMASQQLLGGDLVMALGAKVNSRILAGEFWRLLTPIFIHGSLMHVLFNLYALYSLGQQTEAVAGWLRFGVVFFVAGLSGSVFSLWLNSAPSVGASGAIFGLIGLQAIFLYVNRVLLGERARRSLQNVAAVIVLNLLIGLQGGIDNWAHLGGLIGGLALGWLIGPRWALGSDEAGAPVVRDQNPLTAARWVGVLAVVGPLVLLVALDMFVR